MPHCPHESEKQRHLASIIPLLNEVDECLNQLEKLSASSNRLPHFVATDVAEVLEKSFRNCQVVETLIKEGYRRRFIGRQQVDTLGSSRMRKILDQCRQSELVSRILRDRFGIPQAE